MLLRQNQADRNSDEKIQNLDAQLESFKKRNEQRRYIINLIYKQDIATLWTLFEEGKFDFSFEADYFQFRQVVRPTKAISQLDSAIDSTKIEFRNLVSSNNTIRFLIDLARAIINTRANMYISFDKVWNDHRNNEVPENEKPYHEKLLQKVLELKRQQEQQQFLIEQKESFVNAIETGQLEKVEEFLKLHPLFLTQLDCVSLAIASNQKTILRHVLRCGAMIPDDAKAPAEIKQIILPYKITAATFSQSVIRSINVISDHKLEKKSANTDIFTSIILSKVLKLLNSQDRLTTMEHIDLTSLINSLLKLINKDDVNFKSELRALFKKRADFILNTQLDYCFSNNVSNQICLAIAEMVFPEQQPMQVVLESAVLGDDKPWFYFADEAASVQAYALPNSRVFSRFRNNEINLHKQVMLNACQNGKAGYVLLSSNWPSTDPRTVNSALPLAALGVIRQISPRCEALVLYTLQVEHVSRNNRHSIFHIFEALQEALIKGDYKHQGKDDEAGDDAYVGISSFASWWNEMKAVKPDLIKSLESIPDLSATIKLITDPNKREKLNSNYCVKLRAENLNLEMSRFKNDIAKLQAIHFPQAKKLVQPVAPQSLLDEAALLKEFKEGEIKDHFEVALPMLNFEKLSLVLQYGKEHQCLDYDFDLLNVLNSCHNNKYADAKKIIDLIFQQEDYEKLTVLFQQLKHPTYDYLRTQNGRSRYYGYFDEGRKQTSHTWANIEKAFSIQMVRITVNMNSQPKDLKGEIEELAKAHPAIANNRKGKFHLTASATFGVRNKKTKEKMLNKLNEKSQALRKK